MLFPLIAAVALSVATPECAARVADARPAIEHANGDLLRAMNAGDAAAIAAPYADDGLFVLPDGEILRGRAAVEAFYAAHEGRTPISGGITTQGVACGDDGMLYEWGEGEIRTLRPDGAEARRVSSYLTVWRKVGADWKIVRNLAF